MFSKEIVEAALKEVIYPGMNRDIVSLGNIKSVNISGQSVTVEVDLRSENAGEVAEVEKRIREKVMSLIGVQEVRVIRAGQKTQGPAKSMFLPEVKHKIAVASGKGGVGKSTVSVNLAVSLAKLGLKVGLLDSDIYGPSIPLMFGITEKPAYDGQKLLPIEKFGVKLMSLGFLITDDSPVIWRGPLVMRALQQLMSDVEWGPLDVMIFDMPPGTGDAQLTLSQSITLDGAVIVTTPQDVALLDAVKGVTMFQKVNVPILGIVENMSYFICPHCNEKTEIFSAGGARRECQRLNVPLLGEIPIDMEIRRGGDEGMPVAQTGGNNLHNEAFTRIAEKIKSGIA
ncbi:MAG: iron-sulfur cluster carrier protein ApbC [Calditrichales bacterium]|nr:MAG: iron-sulfur cluster carrier protein ApbC [Calditrichales bacterium]